MTTHNEKFIDKAYGHLGAVANWPEADIPVTALVTGLIPRICKVPYSYLQRDDPRAMAECTLLVQEYFDLDSMVANLDIYNFEGEAMGAHIEFFEGATADFVRGDYFIEDEDDLDKIKFGGLDTGRFPYLIEYCKAYKEYTGYDTFPMFSAPWTLACNLYGPDNLICDTVAEPEFVTEMLNRIVDDFHAPMFKALAKELPGFNAMSLADAFASVPLVDVSIVERFIRPSLERELERLGMDGIGLVDTAFFGTAQLRGEDRKKYEDFIVWSNNAFFCIDPDLTALTPAYARQVATNHGVPLIGGIAATQVEMGDPTETEAILKCDVLEGKNGPTPMIFFFNNLGDRIDPERVRAAVNVVRTFGAAGADENTPCVAPEPLSFKDFLERKLADNPEGYTFEWLEHSEYRYLLDDPQARANAS